MELDDVFPPDGHVQRLYCDACRGYLTLDYTDFRETVSKVDITIRSLPTLTCADCGKIHLPDFSRISIIEMHRRATAAGETAIVVERKKLPKDFGFTDVPFIYDADDYRLIPGLKRPWDEGFLTPVFFNRRVLFKYDSVPGYRIRFSSQTYGQIISDDGVYISFGINTFGKIIMWLGDIAKLPKEEQFYLRSENVASDHAIGSEFYDGQIEVKFTDPSAESRLLSSRSGFLEEAQKRTGTNLAHLPAEVLDLAMSFNAPVLDSVKERKHVSDTLNKIHIESLDNGAMGELLRKRGRTAKGSGSLKRLQALLEEFADDEAVCALILPFYVLYDFRVLYSHVTSSSNETEVIRTITSRLGIAPGATLIEIYGRLVSELTSSYDQMIELLR